MFDFYRLFVEFRNDFATTEIHGYMMIQFIFLCGYGNIFLFNINYNS